MPKSSSHTGTQYRGSCAHGLLNMEALTYGIKHCLAQAWDPDRQWLAKSPLRTGSVNEMNT